MKSLPVFSLAALLSAALPASAFCTVEESAPAAPAGSWSALWQGTASVEGDYYYMRGSGPMTRGVEGLDGLISTLSYMMSRVVTTNLDGYIVEPFGDTKPNGPSYGGVLAYETGKTPIGRISLEFGYRDGRMRDDSGPKYFGGSGTLASEGEEPTDYHINGSNQRYCTIDSQDLGVDLLWRPNHIGDWFGVGFAYDRRNFDLSYTWLFFVEGTMGAHSIGPQNVNYTICPGLRTNDYLVQVRLGELPFAHFFSGKVTLSLLANLAAGYSERDTKIGTVKAYLNGVLVNSNPYYMSDISRDCWTFKGDARIVAGVDLFGGTLKGGVGYACESDIGPNRAGESTGLLTSLSYSRSW